MNDLNVTLGPTEAAYDLSSIMLAPSALKMESEPSTELTKVQLLDGMDRRWVKAQARLTKSQLRYLYEQIGEHLGIEDYERGFQDGATAAEEASYESGYGAGYGDGYQEGYTVGTEDGYEAGASEVAA